MTRMTPSTAKAGVTLVARTMGVGVGEGEEVAVGIVDVVVLLALALALVLVKVWVTLKTSVTTAGGWPEGVMVREDVVR